MSAEDNKAILRRFLDEAYNKGNLGVGDESLSANCSFHTPEADIEGIEGWKNYATGFLTAFPDDLDVNIEDMVAEGNKVVAYWSCRGTHNGDLLGIPPTGKQVTWEGMGIYRFVEGKIEKVWTLNDALGILRQIGALPSS